LSSVRAPMSVPRSLPGFGQPRRGSAGNSANRLLPWSYSPPVISSKRWAVVAVARVGRVFLALQLPRDLLSLSFILRHIVVE
jgi:hypothetical protein